jgi:hypothetical protein
MLKAFTKKVCPFLSLVLTISCGKKISDTSDDGGLIRDHQELPPILVIQMQSSIKKSYTIPRNANFLLPDRVFVRSGNAQGRALTIKYNHEPDHQDFEFSCNYLGTTSHELSLQRCVDHYDREIGPVPENWFPMDQDKLIKLEVSGAPDPDFRLDAFFSVRWK